MDGLNIHYYLDLLRRRILYFVAPFVLVLGGGFAVVVLLPPIYSSTAKILVESQQIPSDLVRSTVTSLADERVQVIQQRVLTRDNLLSMIDKFGLFASKRSKLSSSELVDLMRQRTAIQSFDLSLTGRRSQNGTAVAFTVSFEDERPDLAMKVANELVTFILNEDVRGRTSIASDTTKFLEREQSRLATELANLEAKISAFKLENKDALPEKLQFQMTALENTQKDIGDVDREVAGLDEQKRMLQFENSLKGFTGDDDATGAQLSIPQRLERVKAELAEKSAVYSNSHPDIVALRQQLKSLNAQMSKSLDGQATTGSTTAAQRASMDVSDRITAEKIDLLDGRRKTLVEQRLRLQSRVEALTEIVGRIPEVQNALSLLERQQEATQKQLDEIADKFAKARLGERLETDQRGERFEVLEQATTPQDPVKPNRKKLLVLVAGFAAMAGCGGLLGIDALDQSLRGRKDFVAALNRQPLIVLPYIVTRAEEERRRSLATKAIAACAACFIVGLVALHLFVMPLDVVFMKVASRLQI